LLVRRLRLDRGVLQCKGDTIDRVLVLRVHRCSGARRGAMAVVKRPGQVVVWDGRKQANW
jgi:hypothetical protein